MTHGFRDEAKFALRKILGPTLKDRSGAAHVFDIFFAGLDRRERIEIDGIGVIPAEILLVDRLHIMPDMAVVAARVPGAIEARRQSNRLSDFGGREPMIHQADGL